MEAMIPRWATEQDRVFCVEVIAIRANKNEMLATYGYFNKCSILFIQPL